MMDSTKPKNNEHFYVLTGGPGVGKSSVIKYLKNKTFRCINEVARDIIKEQLQRNGDALPWKNKNLYTDLMLDRSVKDYVRVSRQGQEITFFDRGIPDTLAYAHLENLPISRRLQSYADKYRYNAMVFIFPPWEKIYEMDTERRQSFDEAVKTHEIMLKTYENCGYEPVILPKATVERRGKFILNSICK